MPCTVTRQCLKAFRASQSIWDIGDGACREYDAGLGPAMACFRQRACGISALLLFCSYIAAHGGDIASLRASCHKQLWLTGMQLNNGEFGGSDSNAYLEHMLVCL